MSICKDIYAKSLKQETELSNICTDVLNGQHDSILNKIKQKFDEKMINLENSLSLLEKQISLEYSKNDSQRILWSKKLENLKITCYGLPNSMSKNIQIRLSKNNSKFFDESNFSSNDSNNLGYLTSEYDSLKKSLRLSKDIESQEVHAMQELENQQFSLNNVKSKLTALFNKVDFSNTLTQWLVRRGTTDRQLFFILVFITILITYFTLYYVKPWLKGEK